MTYRPLLSVVWPVMTHEGFQSEMGRTVERKKKR